MTQAETMARSNALRIGAVCITAYLVSYVSRNVLSVTTPYMLEQDVYARDYLGLLSSVYLAVYAVGQLVNGLVGDRVSPRWMIPLGTALSGAGLLVFSAVSWRFVQIGCFALEGFGLSMLTGPIYKLIGENTAERHARRLCVLLSAASFVGPLLCGGLAILLPWRWCFRAAGLIGLLLAAISYSCITRMLRWGQAEFHPVQGNPLSGMADIFRLRSFVFYMMVGAVTGIVVSSVTFWIPTYTTEYLGLSASVSSAVYSVLSVATVICPFLTVTLYERWIHDGVRLTAVTLAVAAVCFGALRVVNHPWLNLGLLLLAKVAASCAYACLWSVYISYIGRSGKVSGANGVLDATGYGAAALANGIFTGTVDAAGWHGLVLLWAAIMAAGAIISGIYGRLRKPEE